MAPKRRKKKARKENPTLQLGAKTLPQNVEILEKLTFQVRKAKRHLKREDWAHHVMRNVGSNVPQNYQKMIAVTYSMIIGV